MFYRTLGRTGLRVSVVGVGTWQFGGEWGQDFTQTEVDAILGAAHDCGINFLDTAECYGDHLSERFIGAALAGRRDRWIIATKFGHHFHRHFERTMHFDPADVVRHLGLSISPPTNIYQTERARSVGAGTIQVVYNRLQRAPEAQVLPACRRDNLGVLARVPLASGFLSGKYQPGATFPLSDVREALMKNDRDAKLAEVQRLAATEVPAGVPMSQWALAWCLKNPAVTAVIPGCKSPEQIRANAAAALHDIGQTGHPQAA